MKVKVISLPYIFQVLYVLCFTRPRYQVSVYRTIGPLVLHPGLLDPESYYALVYKVKKIIGSTEFSDKFQKIIICHNRIGYDLNVM